MYTQQISISATLQFNTLRNYSENGDFYKDILSSPSCMDALFRIVQLGCEHWEGNVIAKHTLKVVYHSVSSPPGLNLPSHFDTATAAPQRALH